MIYQAAFRGLRAVGHVLQLAYYLTGPAAPGRLNAAWTAGKPELLSGLYGTYGHTVFKGTGTIFSNAARGVSSVICG